MYLLHPFLLQANKALIHNIYGKVLVGQGSFDLVQDCRANYRIRKRVKKGEKENTQAIGYLLITLLVIVSKD